MRMKFKLRSFVSQSVLSVSILLAAPVAAAPVMRHKGAADAVILQGVTVPPGSETLILSGQLATPIDPSKPATTMADFGDTRTQTISTFKRIAAVLAARGYTMGDVVKLTVFVAGDPKLAGKMDFAGFNDGYKQFFGTADQPNLVARSTVQVAALAGPMFLVEIEATAVKAPK